MRKPGTTIRLALAIILPSLAVTGMLAAITALGLQYQARQALEQQTGMLADLTVAILTEHQAQRRAFTDTRLEAALQPLLSQSALNGLAVYSPAGETLLAIGLPITTARPGLGTSDRALQLRRALHNANGQTAAWVSLQFDDTRSTLAYYQMLLWLTLFVSVAIVIIGLYGWFAARRHHAPFRQLAQELSVMAGALQDMKDYALDDADRTFLHKAISQWLDAFSAHHADLMQTMQQAAEDLRETLDTVEVQNIELDIARKEALEASRSKSEFLANMSHELRTPLNAIIGFTRLLMQTPMAETQREYLGTIHKSGESLLAIINDVLDFSKIEAGKLALDTIPMDLREVVEDVMQMMSPMAQEKLLHHNYLFFSDVPSALIGDPLRLKQILMNLMANAIKFTEHGEVVLRVSLEALRDEQATIQFTVSDSGSGLTEKQKQVLFRSFEQADSSISRRKGGTGLGLTICKRLTEMMGGEIGFESEHGQGSHFWVRLPFLVNVMAPANAPPRLQCEKPILIYSRNTTTANALNHFLIEFGLQGNIVSDPDHISAHLADAGALVYDLDLFQTPERNAQELLALHTRIPVLAITNQLALPDFPFGETDIRPLHRPLLRDRVYRTLADALRVDNTDAQHIRPPIDNSTIRVLAVDDNRNNLLLLKILLQDAGVTALTAETGMDAVAIFARENVDLVFMDIQMPDIDGMEATRRMRALEKAGQHTPIIALTAHALGSEKRAALQSGLDDYLSKPISDRQLLDVLQRWTRYQTHHRHASAMAPHAPAPQKGDERPVFDIALAVARAGNKPQVAGELLRMLLEDLPSMQFALRRAWKKQDASDLLEHVHRIHGASQVCGAIALSECARTVESALRSPHFSSGAELPDITALLEEIDALLEWGQKVDRHSLFTGDDHQANAQ